MKYRLYRSIVENLITGREVWRRKLVVEDGLLYEDERYECRVYLVAYEGTDLTAVAFTLTDTNDVGVVEHTDVPTAVLLEAAQAGDGALVYYLYKALVAVTGKRYL